MMVAAILTWTSIACARFQRGRHARDPNMRRWLCLDPGFHRLPCGQTLYWDDSRNFDKTLTPFQGFDDSWKYRLEPKQKLALSRVRQCDPDDRRSALAEKRSLSKILIFRNDDSVNAGSILPNHLVFRAAKPNIGDMFGFVSPRRKGAASAGGNCASTRKRIKPRARPGDRFDAPHIRERRKCRRPQDTDNP